MYQQFIVVSYINAENHKKAPMDLQWKGGHWLGTEKQEGTRPG